MSLFHRIAFQPVDPLGDGLREEIAAEQQEPGAIERLEEGLDEQQLSQFWGDVVEDVKNDPEWFHFSED